MDLRLYDKTGHPSGVQATCLTSCSRDQRIRRACTPCLPTASRILFWDIDTAPPTSSVCRASPSTVPAKSHRSRTVYVADWAAAWSPDSTRNRRHHRADEAAAAGAAGVSVVATPDGARLLDLSGEEMSDSHPAWSPDGTQIAFVRAPELPENEGLDEGHIWITPREGPPVQVTDDPAYTERYPQWSPDGQAILFVRLPADAATRETVTPELWAMSPDGANQRKLLELDDSFGGADALVNDDWGEVFDWHPAARRRLRARRSRPHAGPAPSVSVDPNATPSPIGASAVTEWSAGEPTEMPNDVAFLVETGCTNCEGPPQSLVRVYRKPDGSHVSEVLFSGEKMDVWYRDQNGNEYWSPIIADGQRPRGTNNRGRPLRQWPLHSAIPGT